MAVAMAEPIEVITVRGCPRSRGMQIGSARRDSVHAVAAAYEARLKAWSDLSAAKYPGAAECLTNRFAAESPDSLEFLMGVSAASDVPLASLVLAASAYDLWLPGCPAACCTSIAWRDARGSVWMGQTFDWFSDLQGHLLVMRELDETGGTAMLTFAEAGLPGVMGINRFGFTVLVNGLTGLCRGEGVPARLMLARALECRTVSEWLRVLQAKDAMAPLHVMTGTPSGDVVSAEIGCGGAAISRLEQGALCHTNHFAYSGETHEKEGLKPCDRAESTARLELAQGAASRHPFQLMSGNAEPPEEVALFGSLCSEHDPRWYPRTLCCHRDLTVSPIECAETLAAVLLHPETRRMWLWSGNPCSTKAVAIGWRD